jgi:hypothetical protein
VQFVSGPREILIANGAWICGIWEWLIDVVVVYHFQVVHSCHFLQVLQPLLAALRREPLGLRLILGGDPRDVTDAVQAMDDQRPSAVAMRMPDFTALIAPP